MARSNFPKWPSMRYNADGEHRVFESENEVPKGWMTFEEYKGKDKKAAPKKTAAKKSAPKSDDDFPRDEVLAALKDAGVTIKQNISNADLQKIALEEL